MVPNRLSRRALLKSIGLVAAMPLIQACAGAPPTAPAKPAESKPVEAAKPAAAPTSAPAAPPTAIPTAVAKSADTAVLKAPEANPKRGGTIRMAIGVTTPHFDIHQGATVAVLCQMYSNLVRLNLADGLQSIIPDLAQKWEVSQDKLTYTFSLRDGVKFHDGTPFTAEDVVATFKRIISPPQGIAIPTGELFAVVDKVEAPDKLTARFALKEPRSFFLDLLADPTHVIYPKKALDENNQDLKKVIAPGTGAFVLKEHKQAERWVFERSPNYWEKELPYVDQQEWLHVPAWTDRGTAVLTGQADLSWNVSKETWEEGQNRKDIVQVAKFPSFGAYIVILNAKKKPFDDPRVRRAVHLAVSRQDLIQAFQTQEPINVTRWVQQVEKSALPSEELAKLPGYRADKAEDVETAKKLMAEAGYANGIQGVDFLCASVAPHAEIMAPAFQDQLKRTLNIDAKIRVTERALLSQEEQQGNFDMVLDTSGQILPDISAGAMYWKTNGSRNWGGYSSPKFDETLKQHDAEVDDAKRKQLGLQLQSILDEDPPWYLIGFTFHLPMWRNEVKGMALDKRAFVQWGRMETAWIDK
jgi:peptide/nickel transport system substrate-binding protein